MRIVVALGGNALLRRGEKPDATTQIRNVEIAAHELAKLAEKHELVLTHGNGPQVGVLALGSAHDERLSEPYPFDTHGAQTQGMIGSWLLQAMQNALPGRHVAAMVNQTLVMAGDPAFSNPTKFVGEVYTKEEAEKLAEERGWVVKPDGEHYRRVVGLDPDEQAVARARGRLKQIPQAEVLLDDVMEPDLPQRIGSFETVSCVATLHHLPLEPALVRLRELVAPGGRLIVVGLAANKSLCDCTLSALAVLPLHVLGALRRESPDIGVVTRVPRESLAEIRRAAVRLLPGARTRRRFYYRYTLIWDRPTEGS